MRMKTAKKMILVTVMSFAATFTFGQEDCVNKYGSDSVTTVKNLGMFNQYLQQSKYVEAYPYWEYLFNNAPCVSKHITYNGSYIGYKYLQHLKETNEDEYNARLSGLIDTIIMTHDMRIKFWGDEYNVIAKKAIDIFKLKPELRDSAMRLFAKSVEMLGTDVDYKTPLYYMQYAIQEHKRDVYSLDSLFDLYFQLQDIIDFNLDAGGKSLSKWQIVDTTMTNMMKPYFTCEKLEEFFKVQTDATPDDIALLKKVNNLLEIANCTNQEYAMDIAMKLYALEPSSEAAISLGNAYKGVGKTDEALDWYNKGVEGVKDSMERASIYQIMASLEYKQGKSTSARNYAQKVLDLNPNSGAAHLIIASSYVSAKSSCTADGIDGLSVYWAAVDRAVKAKQVDPSVAEDADKFIATYSARFIRSEDAFFKNFPVQEGGSFTVPCLGISTTVRFLK